MAKLSNDSYISQQEKSADYYEKKAKKQWAKAKNGGTNEGYNYEYARNNFDKAKRARERAEEARNKGKH